MRARVPTAAPGTLPAATWWSSRELEVAKGQWCREPPPYSARKPPLPQAALPSGWKSNPPALTRELVDQHKSPKNFLVATYINFKRLDFAYTLVRHLVAVGQPHYLVGAMDLPALEGLLGRGIPSFYINSGLTTEDYGWGTPNFRKMGLHKVQLVLDLARLGVDALTVDADAFILREPWQYIKRFPRADVLMSSDMLHATLGYNHTGLEDQGGFGPDFNIGYIFIRHGALDFVQDWRDACFRSPTAWDQALFAQILRGRGQGELTRKHLLPMYRTKGAGGRRLLAGVLPVALFASGHTFFVTRMAHVMHRSPFMVHTTFQYGGTEGKRHRLREGMMWEDDDDYYAQDFLSFTPDIPHGMVYPSGAASVLPDGSVPFEQRMSVPQHFALVHHQLAQIRDALALAQALGRILVLPRLVCGLDRYWAPHNGIIPGSATQLPLLECPADHVIDLERMVPERLLREHTIFCNPRMKKEVLESRRDVTRAQLLASTEEVRTAHAAIKILHVNGPLPTWLETLSAGPRRKAFKAVVRNYASLWCCNMPPGGRGPGHIWYDFLADVVPHTDRHGRKWTTAWKPIMGP